MTLAYSLAAAALLTGCVPRAEEQGNAVPAAQATTGQVAATIDFSRSDTLREQIEAFSSDLTAASSPLSLRLTIHPAPGEQPDYRVTYTQAEGEAERPVSCSGGAGELRGRAFQFQFNPDYNHLLLTIRHGGEAGQVQARAQCVERVGGAPPAFVIEGRYRADIEEIPTAHDVTLSAEAN